MMNVKLIVVQGRPAGKKLHFRQGEFVFGRGPECHVQPNSDWVSRQHCLLRVQPEGVFIRDLGSRNGTLVNGKLLLEEQALFPGDRVQVGPLVFEVGSYERKPITLAMPASEQLLTHSELEDETQNIPLRRTDTIEQRIDCLDQETQRNLPPLSEREVTKS